MRAELYYGNKKECVYTGYAGNIFGVEHSKVVEEGLYFVKLRENEYIELDELLSDKRKKLVLKDFATTSGEVFVGDLVSINDLVESKMRIKK